MSEESTSLTFSSSTEEPDKTRFSPHAIQDLIVKFKKIISSFPKPPKPENDAKRLDFYLYQASKFMFYTYAFGSPDPPAPTDTQELLEHKAYGCYLCNHYTDFFEQFKIIANDLIEKFRSDAADNLGGEPHFIFNIFELLDVHKEVHFRRTKTSPSKQPTKLRVGETPQEIYDAITGERCVFGDPSVANVWIIFMPLPSDFDSEAIDPKEGTHDHQIALQVDKLQGNVDPMYDVDEPFGIVVEKKWANFFNLYHNIVHFEWYLSTYLLSSSQKHMEEATVWAHWWRKLAGEQYYDKSIARLSCNTKNAPDSIVRITNMRNVVRFYLEMHEELTK